MKDNSDGAEQIPGAVFAKSHLYLIQFVRDFQKHSAASGRNQIRISKSEIRNNT